jgi:hypothetical protein
MLRRDLRCVAEHGGHPDRVFQLPQVSRPIIGDEEVDGRRRDAVRRGPALCRCKAVHHRAGKLGNVGAPLAERRDPDRQHVQKLEEILSKASLRDAVDKPPLRRRDEPNVVPASGAPDGAVRCATAEDVDEPLLSRRRQCADIVEEESAAPRLREHAARAIRAAHRRFAIAGQHGFQQAHRDGAAVDGHERPVTSWAGVVDGASQRLLADPGFALDQHRKHGTCRLLANSGDPLHRRRTHGGIAKAGCFGPAPTLSPDEAAPEEIVIDDQHVTRHSAFHAIPTISAAEVSLEAAALSPPRVNNLFIIRAGLAFAGPADYMRRHRTDA